MEQTCRECQQKFQIPEEDLTFYKKIAQKFNGKTFEMPPPTHCVACRHQRRLSCRNEIFLYHRKCDFSGKQMVSMYSPDKKYTVYDQHVWWSDDWDPLEYGRDYDFSRPFFEQFEELKREVPRMSVNNINAENSDYCNLALNNKDSYLLFTADDNERCSYMRFSDRNYDCYDCDYTYDSTQCYQCLDVEKGNRCIYSWKCYNSSNLTFCYNMIGCQDCICCANLRNKKYCIFNEQYTKEEFEKKKKEMATASYKDWQKLKKEWGIFFEKQPRKYLEIVNCENCLGDYLRDSKNAQHCYNAVGLEDCKYVINCNVLKDCYDWSFIGQVGSERCHEMVSSAYGLVNCHFCAHCWMNCSDMFYSELCLYSKNLFGCISLRHKEYCILNKQYSPEEYEKKVAEIIEHMKETGEWGEFFPLGRSTFAYNESVAQEYFPLTKEQTEQKGLEWSLDESEKNYKGPEHEMPDDINEADEGVCKKIFICEKTGKPFKIIPQELVICKKLQIPLPRVQWMQRHKDRMGMRNLFILWQRECAECKVKLMTTYAPERPEPVLCEKCYQAALN